MLSSTSYAGKRGRVMGGIYVKHSFTDAKDCEFDWEINFAKMTLDIRADFISPALLLSLLESLHSFEANLQRVFITGALAITRRFKVRLEVNKIRYEIRAYTPGLKPDCVEFELLPVGERQ